MGIGSHLSAFLLAAAEVDKVAVTKSILGQATDAMSVMQGVGRGIGSIFILFVIFHHVSSLLDGGKFQIKMLWPLLIYVIVCHFSLVATPVVSFTSAIQSGCAAAGASYRASIISEMTDGQISDGKCGLMDAFMAKADLDKQNGTGDDKVEKSLDNINVEEDTTTDESGKKRWNFAGLVQGFKSVLEEAGDKVKEWFTKAITEPISSRKYKAKWGLLGIVAVIFSWICEFLGLALTCLGAVMTGIIVAFGPVTWSFAIFPGNQRVIGSWLIRLCQFALYSPIVSLINAFILTCLYKIGNAGGDGSLTMLMGILICNIVALTSVPTIASMIIEGASGAVSLSQGLQTAGAAAGTAASMAVAPFKGGFNLKSGIRNWKATSSQLGEASRDDAMLHAMNSIAKGMDPNFTPMDSGNQGSPSGQNPNK